MKLNVLFEGREEYLADTFGKKLVARVKEDDGFRKPEDPEDPLAIIKELRQKYNINPKVLQWVVVRYIKGDFKWEDIEQVKQDLDVYLSKQNIMTPEEKNLSKLTYSNLVDIVDKYKEKKKELKLQSLEKDEARKFFEKGELVIEYKSPDVIVLSPKTEEASCFIGRGTRWCTAATQAQNYFDYYTQSGQLYVLITKDREKFQFINKNDGSYEFSDAQNRPALEKFMSEYKNVSMELFNNFEPFKEVVRREFASNIERIISKELGINIGVQFLSPKLIERVLSTTEYPKEITIIVLKEIAREILKEAPKNSRRYKATEKGLEYLESIIK